MSGQEIILCPQCGGNKVKSNANGLFQFCMAFGILSCLTLIGIPLGIVFIVVAFFIRKSKVKLKFRCQECKHDFKVSEPVYDKYKIAIK